MGYILKFRSPKLYTVIIVAKIKKGFSKKNERVKVVKGPKWLYTLHSQRKTIYEMNNLWYFSKKSWSHFDVFTRRLALPLKCRKTIFQQSRRIKSQHFLLGVNHGHHTDFGKVVNLCPVKDFSLVSTTASIPNPVENLGYIKCYSSSSPRPVKNPSNSIRYNCQKICSWLKKPKTILEIRKKDTFL